MKFQQGLYAAECWYSWNKEVLIKLFADVFISHQRHIEIWFYKRVVFSYPSCILFVPLSTSSLSQALAALCLRQWRVLQHRMKWRWTGGTLCSPDLLCVPVSTWSRAVLGLSKQPFSLAAGFMIYQSQTSQAGRVPHTNLCWVHLCV